MACTTAAVAAPVLTIVNVITLCASTTRTPGDTRVVGGMSEIVPVHADPAERARLLRGLQLLGLRRNSDRSVLHLWARQLPRGMFDGHRSAMVAPDHLIFHGLTKRLVTATFRILSVAQRRRVGVSLREALAQSHFPVTAVYNVKRDSIIALGISEWAATMTVFAVVLWRTLRSANPGPPGVLTVMLRVMRIIDSFTDMVRAAYYCPRVDLDGLPACRARATVAHIQELAEDFFSHVRAACLRDDMAAFGFSLDVPNLHRRRELVDHVIPALLHVRHAQELLFENAHQQLKRAVVSGNGHDDASRAMSRYVQSELAGRIRMDNAFFSIPDHWLAHAGIRACLDRAPRLCSRPAEDWRCSGAMIPAEHLPAAAVQIAEARCGTGFAISWRTRATRRDGARLALGDAVRVLTCPGLSGVAVRVAHGVDARRLDSRPAYFQVMQLFTTRAGQAAAVVHPLLLAADGTHWVVDHSRYLYLPLKTARRALLLHDCEHACGTSATAVAHTASNRWQVLGRETGYPARSG